MLNEFTEFAVRGNVLDLAIAVVIGGAFNKIIGSFVEDVIMPPIGLLLGGTDFSDLFIILKQGDPMGPYPTLALAKEAGAVSINYGAFLNTIISFLIVAFVMFMVVKASNRMRKSFAKKAEEPTPAEPTTKECPFCFTEIPIKATRCPNCTSKLDD
ncbi:MAG: large-conductance mechanosensitive channel protein MscL [Anaerolineaceae bacterium]|nr:large-conductance mechanosensitive channel protein MscL [Anaerolineaceae bacterium]